MLFHHVVVIMKLIAIVFKILLAYCVFILAFGLDDLLNKIRGLLEMIANWIPLEIYRWHAKKFNTDTSVVDGFRVDIIPICH